jgi:hypothetical protein
VAQFQHDGRYRHTEPPVCQQAGVCGQIVTGEPALSVKSYLLSLPERFVRSTVGLGAGVVREAGEVAVPRAVRDSHLYQTLVETTLRMLIEQIGGVEGTYQDREQLADDLLARRTAGNAIELLGVVAFRASPVWVLAALSDLCGAGRQLIPEIADALKKEGLLDEGEQFSTIDQVLDGLERTSARLAGVVNAPPLDVAALRAEWQAVRNDAASIAPDRLPSGEAVRSLWARITHQAKADERSVFEVSSMLAISAATSLPDSLRWLSSSARVAAGRTGHVFAAALLDDYRRTLQDIGEVGYRRYAARQLRPYAHGALRLFSPAHQTLTERLLEKWRSRKSLPPR